MIEPAVQGDYDGLCGLYCIINAVRLVMAPHRELKRDEVRTLFTAGVRFLARQGTLPNAVHTCVGEREWPKLAQRVVARAEVLAKRPIELERPTLSETSSIEDVVRNIEGLIASSKVACVFLRGKYRHYSVISGYTPVTLKLFDSFGHRRVWRRSCGTAATPTALHRFHVPSMITLTAR